jgi:hypothetical protein
MPNKNKSKIVFCPNCQEAAIRTGNEIVCEHCDAVFEITRKQGPKLKKLGPLEDLAKRVEKLESFMPAESAKPEPDKNGSDADESDDDENNNDNEPFLPE